MNLDFLRPYYVKNKIRAGRPTDGGYVLEKSSLPNVDIIYSYGCGWQISFEKAICKETQKTCRIFDPTMLDISNFQIYWKRGISPFLKFLIKKIFWKPYIYLQNALAFKINFYNEGLCTGKRKKYNSFPNHIIQFSDQNKNILLKIDIEGGEYKLFKDQDFVAALKNVCQFAIEFHELNNHIDDLKDIVISLQDKLSLVHIHGNNWDSTFAVNGKQIPITMELTFIANRFLEKEVFDKSDYPKPGLDFPNKPSLPDINLSQLTSRY